MANTDIQVARKHISNLLESQKAQITMALPKHLTADRLMRVALTEMNKNSALYDCNPVSILASVIMAAQLGLEVGVNGQAYLVPYKGVCQLVPGWQGYVDLVSRSGRASVWTGAVRDGDQFSYKLGASPSLDHVPDDEDTGNFTYVYAVGWVKGAQWPVIEVWSRAKVSKHLKQYNKVGERHYALQNENNFEMYGRKVALLQVIKYMPKSIEMQSAQNLDIRASEGMQALTINGNGVTDAEYVDISPEAQNTIDAASTRTDAVKSAVRQRVQRSANGSNHTTAPQPEENSQSSEPVQEPAEVQPHMVSQPEQTTQGASLW